MTALLGAMVLHILPARQPSFSGARIAALTPCPSCAAAVSEGARFCPSCGEAVSSVSQLPTNLASPSVAEAAQRRSPPSSRVGRLASSDSVQAGGFTPGAMLAERYRIIGLLGRGGMGEVYRADDLKLGQPVALKFLPKHLASDRERLERFYAEVRTARQVSHPNVCRVYDVGEVDSQHFLSMEYVDGEDLASLLKRIGHLPADKALEISRELCAGLAAAHERGVLHRDLKPSNVMIDGRGRARITDFGLAVAAGEETEGEVSGTPAYMAPEQLAGKGASVRSDVYSLGLVLYELYTGRKAFDGATLGELRRKHAEETPAALSKIAPGVDPVVERVILRCLEKEPSARPSSVAQVAAALPGGDPLEAALAAGETPSPEMVAAAGEEGALSPARAWAELGSVFVLLVVVSLMSWFAKDDGLAPFPKSPDVLEYRARELVKSFGYSDEPADDAFWWDRQYQYLKYRAAHLPSPRNYRELAHAQPHPWWFWYRQSPRFLVPQGSGQTLAMNSGEPLGPTDPPVEVSGMVNLAMDARGNLMNLRAVPPQVEPAGSSAPPHEPDWRPLLAAAGLDSARLSPSSPRRLPREPFDFRADWEGFYASDPNVPIHVSAASYRGKPVSFEVFGPWELPSRMQEAPEASGSVARNAAIVITALSVLVAGVLVARRNLRLGRGDRLGAMRVSAFLLTTSLISWFFWIHHVPDLQAEANHFFSAIASALFWVAFVWLTYIAIEPIVRRKWPALLISWSRLLAGRFRDPLVGRDVLAGILFGVVHELVEVVTQGLPRWIDLAGMTPMPPARAYLSATPDVAGRFLRTFQEASVRCLVIMTVLVLSQVLLRRKSLAVALTGLLLVILSLSGENLALEIPTGIVMAMLTIFVAVRHGILALAVYFFVVILLHEMPVALDFSRWYAGRPLVLVGFLLALAVYAFHVSLGGKPAFSTARLEEA
jgi:eukaryotic-like serine/threonine-protein kinase